MLKYSPIFFDFDGLLVHTEHLHFQSYQKLLQNHKISFSWNFSTFTSIAHTSSKGLQEAIRAHAPELFEKYSWDTLYKEKKEIYRQLLKESALELMPGAETVLKYVRKAKISHGVVTNSTLEEVTFIRDRLPILKRIPHWITREDYIHPKPAPDAYLEAINMLGKGDKMLGFEDTLRGIHALKGALITPILVSPLNHLRLLKLPKNLLHFSSFVDLL